MILLFSSAEGFFSVCEMLRSLLGLRERLRVSSWKRFSHMRTDHLKVGHKFLFGRCFCTLYELSESSMLVVRSLSRYDKLLC